MYNRHRFGELAPNRTKYIIKTPNNEVIELVGQNAVMELLGCSYAFFKSKKFKDYVLINKIKVKK